MKKTEKRLETIGFDNFELVLFCFASAPGNGEESAYGPRTVAGEIPQRESGLALHLETLAVHQRHEALDEFWFSLSEFLPVVGVHGDVAERGGAVILHVGVWRVEQADKNGDRPGVDELLSVLICARSAAAPNTTETCRAHRPADLWTHQNASC